MPRTLRSAGALAAFLFLVPSLAHADEPKDAEVEARPHAVSIAVAPYLGVAGGSRSYLTVGLEGMLALDALRAGVFAEASQEVFGATVGTTGGFFGVGARSEDEHVEVLFALEGGYHRYSGLGDDLFARTVSGGAASLGFGGVRGGVTYRFGKSRRIGLGLLAFARSDFGHSDVSVTTSGGLFTSTTTTKNVSAGDQTVGAALRLDVSF